METKEEPKPFSQKIQYLQKALGLNAREFTKLFFVEVDDPKENKKKFTSRLKTVKENWLGGKTTSTRGFAFDEYPISKYTIENDTPAFSYDAFTIESFEAFKERVDRYMAYKAKPKRGFEYRYLYYYDNKLLKIQYQQLRIIKELNENKFEIEIILDDFFSNHGIENYLGSLVVDQEYIFIHVQNNFLPLTIYFILNRGFVLNDQINGIGLASSSENGLPMSKKFLLTKQLLSLDEEQKIYLLSNEISTLTLKNDLYSIYDTPKERYIKKFHQTISNLNKYAIKVHQILEDEIKDDAYLQILYRDLQAFNQTVENIANQKEFIIHNRIKLLEVFLTIASQIHNSFCNSVMTVDSKITRFFDKHQKGIVDYMKKQRQFTYRGLTTNRIHIYNSMVDINDKIEEDAKIFQELGVNVRYALKSDLDALNLISYDFVYEGLCRYGTYKPTNENIDFFRVTNNKDFVETLDYNYKKIYELSYTLEEFLKQKDKVEKDDVLSQLVGTWYCYSYRSTFDNIMGEATFTIRSDSTIKYTRISMGEHNGNMVSRVGDIDTKFNQHQSYMRIIDEHTGEMGLILINNKEIYKGIMRVNLITQIFGSDDNTLEYCIFSRTRLKEEQLRNLLGDEKKSVLRSDPELDQKLTKVYVDSLESKPKKDPND